MNVTATSAGSGVSYGPPLTRPAPPPMTNTAQLLGIGTSELSQDLQSGTTFGLLAALSG